MRAGKNLYAVQWARPKSTSPRAFLSGGGGKATNSEFSGPSFGRTLPRCLLHSSGTHPYIVHLYFPLGQQESWVPGGSDLFLQASFDTKKEIKEDMSVDPEHLCQELPSLAPLRVIGGYCSMKCATKWSAALSGSAMDMLSEQEPFAALRTTIV